MYDRILKIIDSYKIIILSPKEIDTALNSDSTNLNWLEADNSIKIINDLNPDKAILDAPSNNIKAYIDYIEKKLKTKTDILAEHKADMTYPVVSTASILAKVTRDNEIKKIQKKIKENIGSGYPSDPITQSFLEKNYKKYPEIFRKTWQSYQRLVKSKGQSKLGDF
jgi:ribonuclease HII